MIEQIFKLFFYGLMIILAIQSILMIFVLVRFGKSKTLGLLTSAVYFAIMGSLYIAATVKFFNIPF